MPSLCAILAFGIAPLSYAATVTYDFNVGWVHANPDGAFVRPVMGINGQWPLPPITASVGDRVIVNVQNNLGNQTTSIHFHGLYMNGTNDMDGVVGVTQCGIPPGGNFTYDFNVSHLPHIRPPPGRNCTDSDRLINLAHIGIIHTSLPNTLMDSEGRCSSAIPILPIKDSMMRKDT